MTIESSRTPVWSAFQSAVWSPKGDKVAFLILHDGGNAVPVIYVRSERRVVTPGDIQIKKSKVGWEPALGWIDDTKLILSLPEDRSIKILGPGLAEERTLSIPTQVGEKSAAWSDGSSVFLADFGEKGSVWRLDLKTEKWKKIW
jgi:hypothetical protein